MILVDGESCDALPADDRGLAYGDGLFETIAVIDGQPLALDHHLARLTRDAIRLGLTLPATEALKRDVETLARGCRRGVAKLIVTRGSGGRGYRPGKGSVRRVASLHPWPQHGAVAPTRAWLCAQPLSVNPALAGLKHLNRLDQVLASREWPGPDYLEGLMCDPVGNLVEGTRSNVFLVIGDELVTPDLADAGVAGIVRAAIIELAANEGRALRIRPVKREELIDASEVFVSNSVLGLRPISEISGMDTRQALANSTCQYLATCLRAAGVIA